MSKSFVLPAALLTVSLLAASGCDRSNEVAPPPPDTAASSDVPEGMSDAEYAKAMAESMKGQ